MASRREPPPPPEAVEPGPMTLRPGMPVRLLVHDWPFLYSVLPNGDLVINKRLPPSRSAARSRAAAEPDDEGAASSATGA
jgi:hypothetical protein